MSRPLKLSLPILFLVVFVLKVTSQHQIDLTGNVTLYGQQSCCYCGAASGQMIMDGYPNIADRTFHQQLDIWNSIQTNNSTNATDVAQGWCTDPEGLRGALMALNPPTGGTWNVHANTNRDIVMFNILYWMNRNDYPVATLINQGGHWVVIVGFESDVAPVAGSNPTLQQITIYDPEPHNVGTQITKTANTWYNTDWNGSIIYAGTWDNQYVAVIEPPTSKGRIQVKTMKRTGEKIIQKEEAIKYALKSIDELKLFEKPQYRILKRKDTSYLDPILVREEIKLDTTKENNFPYYYIVPFGFEYETGECGVRLARVSVIINAYTGQFEEIGNFGKPIRYLPENEAINIVLKALKIRKDQKKEVRIHLMFQPSEISHIRLYPFWKVEIEDKVLYVDQLGTLYNTIKPCNPGD